MYCPSQNYASSYRSQIIHSSQRNNYLVYFIGPKYPNVGALVLVAGVLRSIRSSSELIGVHCVDRQPVGIVD